MPAPPSSSVLVVGAGIVGLAAAWQAAGWDRHSVIADPGPAAPDER